MNISKLFCMVLTGLAIIGFATLGYASHEEASHAEEVKHEAAASEHAHGHEGAKEETDAAHSTDDIQYGAESKLKSDEEEAKAADVKKE